MVTRDIGKLINLGFIEEAQKDYLKSLVTSLQQATHKIVKRIAKFHKECPQFGDEFVVNGYVIRARKKNCVDLC